MSNFDQTLPGTVCGYCIMKNTIVTHYMQGKTRRTAGHGGPRRATERYGGQADAHATACYGMQGAMSVSGPLPFPTITGAWEWGIGGEGEERKEYQHSEFSSSWTPQASSDLGVRLG
jgi:hypothetical protein